MIETINAGSVLQGNFPILGIENQPLVNDRPIEGFADLLADGMDRIQELTGERDQLTIDMALGKPVELHQVMLAATKAQLALELFIELRNKFIEAYQEISRMPV